MGRPEGIENVVPESLSGDQQTIDVCGYALTPTTPIQLLQHVLWMIESKNGGWVLAINLDLVSRGVREPDYADLIRKADLSIADGYPLVWAMRRKSPIKVANERVTGSDLTQALLHLVDPSKTAIIGGKNPSLALEREGLAATDGWFIFDGIVKMDADGIADLRSKIEGRSLVFVALGVPKQERLILALRETMPETTFIGVGGSFEFLAGLTSRAPKWMQRNGMEWLYRLCTEPRRLWRRYLIEYIPGAVLLWRDVRDHDRKL